jgi:hypothetical protein
MTVAYVGAQGAAATSVTIPAHQVGDLILVFAYRDGSNTVPTTPAAGGTVPTWTTIVSSGGNTNSSTFAYAVATATTTTSGTWTNATEIIVQVYRGATVGASTSNAANNSSAINFPALTLQRTDSSSWVVGVAGHRTATNVEVAPTGMTNRVFAGTEIAGHDTAAGVTTWNSTTVTVNSSSGWRSAVLELRDKTSVLVADKGAYVVTTVSANLVKKRSIIADKGSFTVIGKDANLLETKRLVSDKGLFFLSGVPANVLHKAVIGASPSAYTVSEQPANIARTLLLTAAKGTLFCNTQNAALLIQRKISVQLGTFSIVGHAADLHYLAGIDVNTDHGSFFVSGTDSSLFRGFNLTAATRAFYVLGNNANLVYKADIDKPFYYQTLSMDPRKMVIPGSNENQLVYYVNNFLRIL